MEFAIITALISIITLSFKYMEESMKSTDYTNLLILNHAYIVEEARRKLRQSEFSYNYIVVIASFLLVLSKGLTVEKIQENSMLLIGMIIIVFLVQKAINEYSTLKIRANIHHSVEHPKIKTSLISILVPSISLGIILGYCWMKPVFTDKSNDIIKIDYIIVILVLVTPFLNYLNVIKKNEIKDFKAVKPDSNIIIQTKENQETKEIKIDIIKNNISIDKDGYVWVYNRNNIKEDIAYFKLDENTTLQIGDKRITNKKDDIETNYAKYI